MKKVWVRSSIFIILCVCGLILSQVCLDETNITSLLSYHDRSVYTLHSPKPLVPAQGIYGEFQAVNDNLGMVKLRIRTFNRINTTHIRFQIREKGNSTILATNEYATDRFEDGLLYPFGFPVITDSKGKWYVFALDSLDGTFDNAIGVVSGYHDTATQYVFGKTKIFSAPDVSLAFLSQKIKSLVFDPYMILYMSIFLLPSFVFLFPRYHKILAIYGLLIYTYIPLLMHSNAILVVSASVFAIALFTRATASRIYGAAIMWLVQIPFMLAFGNILAANRASTLIFFFICIGGIISLMELKKQ